MPSSILADKLICTTFPCLELQVMPPHEHGEVSEWFQLSSSGDNTFKPFLNYNKANPSIVKAPAMYASKVDNNRQHPF